MCERRSKSNDSYLFARKMQQIWEAQLDRVDFQLKHLFFCSISTTTGHAVFEEVADFFTFAMTVSGKKC